jgi:hypothetical protein
MQPKDLIDIADFILQKEHKDKIPIIFKNIQRGWAKYDGPVGKHIIMPTWIFAHCGEYQISYIIHEVCHFLVEKCGHTPEFKEKETYWLKQFGFIPIYSKAYTKALLNLDGKVVWAATWKKSCKIAAGDYINVKTKKPLQDDISKARELPSLF